MLWKYKLRQFKNVCINFGILNNVEYKLDVVMDLIKDTFCRIEYEGGVIVFLKHPKPSILLQCSSPF